MKTVINSAAAGSIEFAKRILYSFEVLGIGVILSFLFIAGINSSHADALKNQESVNSQHKENTVKMAIDFNQILSDQNG